MSEACPGCGQIMEHGFLQTGGGPAAFGKGPRMLMLREDQGDIRLPVSRLTKACPAWYCARCRKLIVSWGQENAGAELERASRGNL